MTEARLFQALSDSTRLKIIDILAEGPRNVTGIVNLVKAAQPAVSRHLRILREVGLIRHRRVGKEVEYWLDSGRVREACGWLGELLRPEDFRADGGVPKGGDGRAPGDHAVREEVGKGGTYGGGDAGGEGPGSGPGSGRHVRPRRISPLAARRAATGSLEEGAGTGEEREQGVGSPAEVAAPAQVETGRTAASEDGIRVAARSQRRKPRRRKGARMRSTGGSRVQTKRPGRPRSKAGGRTQPKQEADNEPAYIIEREDDSLDDFLL
jgi:DNA-binding transcriptional ArsR family regulator